MKIFLLFGLLFISTSMVAQEDLALRKQFSAAVLYHTQGNYDDSIDGCSRVIYGNPKYIKAYFFRGYSYLKKEDYDNAISDFKIVTELDKRNDKAFFYIGKIYYSQDNYEEAIGYFNKAISINPKHVSALNDRGMCNYQIGNYDEAIKSFQSAVNVDSSFAMAYNNIGTAIFFNQNVAKPTKRDLKRAEDAFTTAIKLDPTLFVAHYNRAAMNYFLKKYDAALKDIDNATTIQPENAMCFFYSGVILRQKKEYTAALAQLKYALDLVPTLSFAYEEIAKIQADQEQYLQAVDTYGKAIELSDNNVYIGLMHYYQAVTYAKMEDEDSMYAALKKAHSKKAFRDKKVYQAFLKEKSFKPYRKQPRFKKMNKKARKGKKTNKFEANELSWFRLEF